MTRVFIPTGHAEPKSNGARIIYGKGYYNLDDDLAKRFVDKGIAVLVDESDEPANIKIVVEDDEQNEPPAINEPDMTEDQ